MDMARGPKLAALVFTAVVATLLLINRSGGTRHEALNIALLHLEDGYILYFQPNPKHAGTEASVEVLDKYADEYELLIQNFLDGEILQRYDTLMHGLSFQLKHTSKVQEALGTDRVPPNLVQSTDERLLRFLQLLKADDMALHGVMMTLERDKTMSTQGDGISA